MHRSRPALVLAVLFSALSIIPTRAQSNTGVNPPCTPPPNSASSIVCFGSTPCPPGYVDPVGSRRESTAGIGGLSAMQNPNQQRWICLQESPTVSPNESSAPAAQTSATPLAAAPATATPAAAATSPAQIIASGAGTPPPVVTTAANPPASTTVAIADNPTAGFLLTDPTGLTLYTRSTDPPNGSSCTDACAIIWLPLQAGSGPLTPPSGAPGPLATITRDDGTKQVAYNGAALYTFTGDLQPGDVNGAIGGFQPATP